MTQQFLLLFFISQYGLDHDIVFTELDINPQRAKQKPRDIPLYKKANWENIKEDLKSIKKILLNP